MLLFESLLVIKPAYTNNSLYWELLCDCGEKCFATSTDLNRGRTNYCKKCVEKKSLKSALNLLFMNYKRHAKDRNLIFELTIEEFSSLISMNCFYCKLKPMQTLHKKGMRFGLIYNGIDRQDNAVGYILSNCVPACKYCNFAKREFPLNEFLNWIEKLKHS